MPIPVMTSRMLAVSLAALAAAWPAAAHEFWLRAHPFVAGPGQPVEISLHVGERLAGVSLPNRLDRYVEFSHASDDGPRPVAGELGRDPAGVIESPPAGTFAVAYRSVRSWTEVDRATFTRFQREEGLDAVPLPAGDGDIEDYFVRFAKTLVRVGEGGGALWRADFGWPLELHSVQDPYADAAPDLLRFRLTRLGAPAAGVLVKAYCAGRPGYQQRLASDADGVVAFAADCHGMWRLRTGSTP